MPVRPTFNSKTEERGYLKFRLAQAFRIFANLGYTEGVAGHITVRDPIKPDCFWVNPFGIHFALIQPDDLLLVSHDGKILDESGPVKLLNKAAYMIHSAVHNARPDVLCAAHTHSIYGKAFSALGIELDMLSQDTCTFYNDHALYNQFNGIVLDEQEGIDIAKALGNKKAVILQNHGLLVATDTIEATVYFFTALERACQAQLLADAAAGKGQPTIKINHEEAAATGKKIGNMYAGYFKGRLDFQLLELREGVTFEGEKSEY